MAQDGRGVGLNPPGTPTPEPPGRRVELETKKPELVLQTGHSSGVVALAFSPAAQLLASGSVDHTVKLWDVATAREVRTLSASAAVKISAVAFSPEGEWLAAGGVDGSVALWDVAAGRFVRGFSGHSLKVLSVAFSPDCRFLASAGADQTAKLWEVHTGREVRTLSGHAGWITAVAFSSDGRLLATGSTDRTVKLWNLSSGRETATLQGHAGEIGVLTFDPQKRWLASGDADATVIIWDYGKKSKLHTLGGHAGKIVALSFSPDGRALTAAGAARRMIKTWEVVTGRETSARSAPDPMDQLEAAAFSSDGRWLASSNGGQTISLRGLSAAQGAATAERTLASCASGVYANAFSPDGKWFAAGGKDNTVRLWETATGRELYRLKGDTGWITSVAFSPDSQWLATGGLSGSVKIWEVLTGRERLKLAGHAEAVNAVAFNRAGVLASAGNDRTVKLWDAREGRELRTLSGHAGEVKTVAFSPNGRWLATGSADKTVRLWDVETWRELRAPATTAGEVNAVAFSPDGQLLAAGGRDLIVTLWEMATGREARTLFGHANWITAIAFAPDGRTLATGSRDNTIKLWETSDGREVRTLFGHADQINSLAFATSRRRGARQRQQQQQGQLLASGSEDGTTRLWDAPSGEQLATLMSLRESDDWIVVAPDGSFDGAPEAWGQILWRFEQNTFNVQPVEVFFNEFYYPGLLADLLAGKKAPAAADITQRDRRQPSVKIELAAAPPAAAEEVVSRQVTLRVTVREALGDGGDAAGSGAQDLRLFRNGTLVKVWRGDVLSGRGGQAVIEATVPVVAGENQLTAYAFNRDNVKSADAELSLRGGANLKRPGVIYILAVGLDQYANAQYNLKFAAADARVFADEVRRAQAELAPPARLEVVTLFDHEATKANVLHALTRLSGDASAALPPGAPPSLNKLQPAQPEDTVIVFHAGHGMAFGQRFYLLPHDFGYTGARAAIEQDGVQAILGHSISDRELEQVLEGVDAGRLLMVLDTCESGKVLESEEQRQRQGPMNSKGIAQLAYEKGMFVLTAAQSYQAALEVEQLGHGFLTHALVVQGLREGRADARPRDGRIMTGEWLDYATERVPQLQLEWMRTTRGLMSQIAFVAGEEWLNDPGDRSLQRPRVFYRRETQRRPLIIAQLGAVRSGQ